MNALDLLHRLIDSPLDDWPGTVVLVLAAAIAGWVSFWFLARVLRRLTRPLPVLGVVVRSVAKPAWAVWLSLAIDLVLWQASDSMRMIGVLRELTTLGLVAGLTWLAASAVAAAGNAVVAQHPLDTDDNLTARRIHTQTRVLVRSVVVLIIVVGVALMLMSFPNVRQIGASLLASAGVAGLVAGIAARPVLGNLIAGLQIALSQPIRIDDVVVIQGEWGRIEEITGTYVLVRIWDQRRLVVPLQWIIENPFTNWTRTTAEIIGTVFLYVDFRMPLEPLRAELLRLCEAAPEWDGRVQLLQVTDATEQSMQLRALVTSTDSGQNWDLRCRIREGLLVFMQQHYAEFLPRSRTDLNARIDGSPAIGQARPDSDVLVPESARPPHEEQPLVNRHRTVNTPADPMAGRDEGHRARHPPRR
jgi:small-conductance mechanosensitive channel